MTAMAGIAAAALAATPGATGTAADADARAGTATVGIVSPPAGVTVAAGRTVSLLGASYHPDTYQEVALTWKVFRNGTLVHSTKGHLATIPAAKVTPGTYALTVSGGGGTAKRSLTVIKTGALPVATITTPAGPLTKQSLHGKPVAIAFAGKGVDAAKKAVPGTRYRWTAYGTNGAKKGLCTGSAVPRPGSAGDKVTAYRSCASFTASLGMLPGDVASTRWSVWLEVFGASGPAGVGTAPVKLTYVAL